MLADDLTRHIDDLSQQAVRLEADVAALGRQRQRQAPGSADFIALTGDLDAALVDLEDARADLQQARRRGGAEATTETG